MLNAWQTIAAETRAEYEAFISACAATERTQFECLMAVLANNANSGMGKHLDFKSIKTIDDFRARLPIVCYDDLVEDIKAQTNGRNGLCAEPVRFYEQTGGSTGGAKLVPFTASALTAMHRAVEPWLSDLLRNRPAIGEGLSYWSISPALNSSGSTADGTPIGSGSDLAFIREELQSAFASTLVSPPDLASIAHFADWQLATLLSLLMWDNLRLISIWSPSFLTTLMTAMIEQSDRLLAVLDDPCNAGDTPAGILAMLGSRQARQAAAARLKTATSSARLDTRVLWPRLDTISCWAHGPACCPAQELQALFPHAFLQPKGLLATEGAVSLPLCAASMPVLAVRSGFFEFMGSDERCHLAHELEPGEHYRVVMTTHSGFYRYDLGDTVVAHGGYCGAPMLEFLGRQGVVSDICGEKLSDAFVSRCLASIRGFALIAPQQRGYSLFVDSAMYAESELANLADAVEAKLERNPQYAYARRIGQLAPLQAVGVAHAAETYFERKAALGQRIGDIKPAALSLDVELHSRFLKSVA